MSGGRKNGEWHYHHSSNNPTQENEYNEYIPRDPYGASASASNSNALIYTTASNNAPLPNSYQTTSQYPQYVWTTLAPPITATAPSSTISHPPTLEATTNLTYRTSYAYPGQSHYQCPTEASLPRITYSDHNHPGSHSDSPNYVQGSLPIISAEASLQKYNQYQMPPFEQSVTVSGYHNLSYPQTPVGTSAYLAQDTESSPLEETPNILRPPSSHSATSQGEDKKGSRSRSNSPGKQKQTYACDLPNCTSTAQFTRLADLQRHQSTVHNTEKPFPCNISGCNRVGSRGFNRRDHLTEHQRSFHQIEIPKRRPGQRTARQTYQINSPNDQH